MLKNPIQSSTIITPVGKLLMEAEDEFITNISFVDKNAKLQNSANKLLQDAEKQIKKYFSQKHFDFDLPLKFQGTKLQQKVWRRLQKIPYGETITYGEIAKELNTCARAIGGACRLNPILLAIPCHRVVAINGLGGFSGKKSGLFLEIKKMLLAHEKN